MSVDQALQTQLNNIQKKTGKSLEQLFALIKDSGLEKHGQIRDMLKKDLDLGHGDANTLTHVYRNPPQEADGEPGDVLDEIYVKGKEPLRPIHEALMARIDGFGDFEIAPKKGYVSLRRKKQFAMIKPATKTRVEVGLNMKGLDATDRLIAFPPGRMCQYKVDVTEVDQVDDELIGWIQQAYDSAG